MSDSENCDKNKKYNSQIQFRKKNKYLRFGNIVRFISFILVAAISGAISSRIILKKALSERNFKQELVQVLDSKSNSLQKEFSESIEKVSYSLVSISDDYSKLSHNTYKEGNISGIVVRKEGYIITSYSKIKNYKKIFVNVTAPGIKATEGELVGYDEGVDIALIKIDYDNLIPIGIADENSYKEGDFVISIGNAVSDSYVGISLPGVITSTNEIFVDANGNSHKMIQTNTVINDFNNGGPICNLNGELIAINSKVINEKFDSYMLNYSISGDKISSLVDEIIEETDILGVNRGVSLNDSQKNVEGVYVSVVKAGGVADKAGICPTDIILDMNGVKVDTPEDIYSVIKDKTSGDIINTTILHDGVKKEIEIIIE